MNELTECQKRLVKALPRKYYVDELGKFQQIPTMEEETDLEFFILQTYGE